MNLVVFTLCSSNFLAQALTLGDSVLRYNPGYRFIIGLVDRSSEDLSSIIPYEIIEVEQLKIAGFNDMIFRYDITELNTAVKPFFFNYLFERLNASAVIYLDPDIQVFAPFTDLEKEIKDNNIIIIPHITRPLNDHKVQKEEDFLNSGLYNLGFLAVKNSVSGLEMISWWGARLRFKAFIDFKRGLFTDQIWINFVPLFFDQVKIFLHPGYNMAYWNLHERTLTKKNRKYYVNSVYPLVFYHFSGYDPFIPAVLSKYQDRFTFENKHEFLPLFDNYTRLLLSNGYQSFINRPCYYIGLRGKRL
jgi:hypothetical protein